MEPIPLLGLAFQKVFPTVLVVLVVCNAFDLWSRFLSYIGLQVFAFSAQYDEGKAEEGRVLVKGGMI